jgi:Glycyl-tRNA synthetase (class II)
MPSFSLHTTKNTLALSLILSASASLDNMYAFQSTLARSRSAVSSRILLQNSRAAALTSSSLSSPSSFSKHFMTATDTSNTSSLKVVPVQDAYDKVSMDDIVSLCKRRGFIFPSSEIYNGFAGFYDYGPLGAELKKNVKDVWWKTFVTAREDVVGLDSSIIHNPTTWKSSGR